MLARTDSPQSDASSAAPWTDTGTRESRPQPGLRSCSACASWRAASSQEPTMKSFGHLTICAA